MSTESIRYPKPFWLKKKITCGSTFHRVREVIRKGSLHTVCEEALCPNRGDCYSNGTATFLILGDRCTRSCRFCAVEHNQPRQLDPEEPGHIAETVSQLGLQHVVITSVTRDDLPYGGANHFAETIREIRMLSPHTSVEVLIPDFQGNRDALDVVVSAHPDVIGHNIETAPRLYAEIRNDADYSRSLNVLKHIYGMAGDILTKSGIMLGMGETRDEIMTVLSDLLEVNCAALTMGQYLQPRENCVPVQRFLPPEEFTEWAEIAVNMGFHVAVCGPFVRSSYHAGEIYRNVAERQTHGFFRSTAQEL